MGLNFHIGNRSSEAQWSYSGFNEFRSKIATLAGIDLNDMLGFHGCKGWGSIKDDIVILLNHSDCDGYLTPKQCKKIYPRLLELVNILPGTFTDHYDKRMAKILAEDMKECAEKNVKLIFT